MRNSIETLIEQRENFLFAGVLVTLLGIGIAWDVNQQDSFTRSLIQLRAYLNSSPASTQTLPDKPQLEVALAYKDPNAPKPLDIPLSDDPPRILQRPELTGSLNYLLDDNDFISMAKTNAPIGWTFRLKDFGMNNTAHVDLDSDQNLIVRVRPTDRAQQLESYTVKGNTDIEVFAEVEEYIDGQMKGAWIVTFWQNDDGSYKVGYFPRQLGADYNPDGTPNTSKKVYVTIPEANLNSPGNVTLDLDPFAQYVTPAASN